MLDPFLVSLVWKLAAAALVVVVAAMLVERTGPFIGAMVVTLPITTGPSYVFLALDHTAEFLAASAASSLVANAATPIFMSVYALLAPRRGVVASLGIALATWAAMVACSLLVPWTLGMALAANVVLYAIGALLLRGTAASAPPRPAARQWWDLPMRVVAVMSLCCAVILTAHVIGPQAAGLVALTPMGFTSMALVVHPRLGGATSAAIFANALPGMIGFAGALFTVHATVVPLGVWSGFGAGLAVGVAWNATLVAVRHLRSRR